MSRRRWFQFSLLTAIVMMFTASGLLGFQMRPLGAARTVITNWTTVAGLSMRVSLPSRILEGEPARTKVELRNDSGKELPLGFNFVSIDNAKPADIYVKEQEIGAISPNLPAGETMQVPITVNSLASLSNYYRHTVPCEFTFSFDGQNSMTLPASMQNQKLACTVPLELVFAWNMRSVLYALLVNLPLVILAGVICEFLVRRQDRKRQLKQEGDSAEQIVQNVE